MVAASQGGSGPVGDPLKEPWRQLYRYWRSKHVDGHPPARADIDPITEIPRLVANLMIIDSVGDDFVYRFVGTDAVNQTGEDMTGRSVGLSRKYASSRAIWLGALEAVRTSRQPRLIIYRFGAQSMTARQAVLLLPLHAEPGTVFKILGGAFQDGDFPPGQAIEGVTVQELLG
ncbi:MAG TPA: PAS domain-containing protein [Alphaproteobacteria bacterium]|jgi:hypothetical protein|nr:PAS domain-containing protein [Alphaproteobacteria bacterium]